MSNFRACPECGKNTAYSDFVETNFADDICKACFKREAQGVAFDVGTSPHGLSNGDLPDCSEASRTVGLHSLGNPQAPKARAERPEVYRRPELRSCCRSLRAAVLKQAPSVHRLAVDDSEFLHLFYAVEHDRNKMRKAIGKGLAVVGDLRATDTLWLKLQSVMARRQFRRPT